MDLFLSSPLSVHQPFENDNFGEPTWRRPAYTNLQFLEATLKVDCQPRQSLPSPTFSNDPALVSAQYSEESTPTTLPSFKELDKDLDATFPSFLPSPPSGIFSADPGLMISRHVTHNRLGT
jgi:hypothetical protein